MPIVKKPTQDRAPGGRALYKDDICPISHLNLLVHLFELLPSRVGHLLLLHSEE